MQQLAERLHRTFIKLFLKKCHIYSSFKDNIWDAHLADKQLIGKFDKRICFYYVVLISLVNMRELFL